MEVNRMIFKSDCVSTLVCNAAPIKPELFPFWIWLFDLSLHWNGKTFTRIPSGEIFLPRAYNLPPMGFRCEQKKLCHVLFFISFFLNTLLSLNENEGKTEVFEVTFSNWLIQRLIIITGCTNQAPFLTACRWIKAL